MKEDGTSMDCIIDGEQLIKVKTSSGESNLKLSDVVWMAGKDMKRIRLSGKSELTIGEIEKNKIRVKKGEDILFISTEDIVFFYNDFDKFTLKKGKLDINEHDGVRTAIVHAFEKAKGVGVYLLPENWEGNISISNPIYSREISNRSDFKITVDIQGDNNLYSDLTKKVYELRTLLIFSFDGGWKISTTPLINVTGSLPNSKGLKTSISNTWKYLFYMPGQGEEIYGKGFLYYCLTTGHGPQEFGGGTVSIYNTASNVLKLPFTAYNAEQLAKKVAEEKAEKRLKELAMISEADTIKIDVKFFVNSMDMEFVYIPAGTFLRGSFKNETGRLSYEKKHRVILNKGFYMQSTEVTQGQWERVMGSNPSYFKECGAGCPVEEVSWSDVQEFIKKLNQLEETDKYRLPTEAEWEYACRAGNTDRFSYGDDEDKLGEYAWYMGNSGKKTHPVGQKKPNVWGLYDMHGNVWEWCEDLFGDYPSGSVTDPMGISSASLRVIRGGSRNNAPGRIRCAFRNFGEPGFRYDTIGFRLLRKP